MRTIWLIFSVVKFTLHFKPWTAFSRDRSKSLRALLLNFTLLVSVYMFVFNSLSFSFFVVLMRFFFAVAFLLVLFSRQVPNVGHCKGFRIYHTRWWQVPLLSIYSFYLELTNLPSSCLFVRSTFRRVAKCARKKTNKTLEPFRKHNVYGLLYY